MDDELYDELAKYKWRWLSHGGYAVRQERMPGERKTKNIFMHRVVTNAPDGVYVDHINRNPLDNRRVNLRFCTHQQNQWNRPKESTSNSPYKGVLQVGKAWRAYISKKHLGSYDTPEEAARVYDRAAWEMWGEFAYRNFPDVHPSTYPPIRPCVRAHRWLYGPKCHRCGETRTHWRPKRETV